MLSADWRVPTAKFWHSEAKSAKLDSPRLKS